jgi:phage baseplate assembly protein W
VGTVVYEIDTSKKITLNWAAKGFERILQNVINLINTWQYEIAYNRTMGLQTGILDKPSEEAATEYISQVHNMVSSFEPRAEVQEVNYTGIDENGNMVFKVVIDIE